MTKLADSIISLSLMDTSTGHPKQGSGGLGNRLSLLKENISLVVRKPVFWVSDLFRHKPGCTATEDSQSLEISDLGSRWVGLRLCFRIFKNPVFL